MSDSQWFEIPDLEEFTNKARLIVYNNFGSWENIDSEIPQIDIPKDGQYEELDNVLSQQESLLIVKENITKERNKRTKKSRYIINDDMFIELINKLNDRMISNILKNLTSKGLIETAFDEEANDFIFWIKDNIDDKEKPETD